MAHPRPPPRRQDGARLAAEKGAANKGAGEQGAREGAERPSTLGALLRSGWRSRTVKEELCDNLARRLSAGEPVFEGLHGYQDTVVPQVCNAVLAGHDFILLGLRGQAKSRILRSLAGLLDEAVPAVAGSELREDPLRPVTEATRRRLAELGEATPIEWIERERRYSEKLATPDVTISDLIGDIDPIKAANLRLSFADPEVVHYGILPRANRGIFAVNELPDLASRIQVGLLNILEEGDVQIRGFPVRLALDVLLVFSANPEDYTNRGRIITPLRDRIASQILTHYPRTLEVARAITDQESRPTRAPVAVRVPPFVRDAIERVAFQARQSDMVDQNSGVSARMGIALHELVLANAQRRGLRNGRGEACARPGDLLAATAAVAGKLELVYEGEREGPQRVALHLVGRALKEEFDAHFPDAYRVEDAPAGKAPAPRTNGPFDELVGWFQTGATLDVSDRTDDEALEAGLSAVPGLAALAERFLGVAGEAPGVRAAAMELVLEGLHHSSLLARDELSDGRVYKDMFREMVKELEKPGR